MEMIQSGISLRLTGNKPKAFLSPISGSDEKGIYGTTTPELVTLIGKLIERRGGLSLASDDIYGLTASDRDRLSAALYRDIYGDRIDATLRCRSCESIFDIDFQLASLQKSLYREQPEASADETYQTPQGYVFRLPTSEDEIETSGAPQSDAYACLLEKILVDPCYQDLLSGSEARRREVVDAVESQLTRIAPIVDLEMNARCPECSTEQKVHFDLQRFFLERLLQDRRWLMHEIHMIANAYGWSLDNILSLSRRERKELANLIDDQRLVGRRWS